ncbi:MAG: hypothetical protein R6W90_08205 [Ignavibacteriaceae bacterium]
MEIKSISNNLNFFNKDAVKKQAENKPESSKDRLEISAEAKVFESASKKVPNLEEIRQRIDSKYYNSEEVIQKVAEKILKEISE